MARKRIALTNRKQRSVLTDMLPFEVPPTFSNRGFYRFLCDNKVFIEDGILHWTDRSPALDATIQLIFNLPAGPHITASAVSEWGKSGTRKSAPLKKCRMDTIPFNFSVSHKLDGRILSVVHPRNQVEVAGFYASRSGLILYSTSISDFSIRRPISVSKYAFFRDRLHEKRLDTSAGGIEVEKNEYEQLGSYFVYRKYRNIHRFFESYAYHRAEKKYKAMVQIDVSKCFDSIYTHSLSWATLGKTQTKFYLEQSKGTFSGSFDSVMQNLNHRETNGIVIGPEFSRIFAEIILQSIDIEVQRNLKHLGLEHKIHYDIFRYVDDYFVFYDLPSTRDQIFETLQSALKTKKLSINTAKIKPYEKPIITEITIAKEKISTSLNSEIDPQCAVVDGSDSGDAASKKLLCDINSNRLIIRFKTIIQQSKVEYGDLLNYTLAIVENKLDKMIRAYLKCDQSNNDRKRMVNSLAGLLEFAFFIYSASPKVNHTVRICRLISTTTDFLNAEAFSYDLKHFVFKYIYDNVIQQLDRNTMSTHREVENLYLLISLSQIGKEYWLPEATITKHMLIKKDAATGTYQRDSYLSHFSITVLLAYMKRKVRYDGLRRFIEAHSIEKLSYSKAHCHNDAEALILFLDLAVCPYVTASTKTKIADIFGLDATAFAQIQSSNDHWFTAWGDKFDLSKELDAKRSREVY